jgi:hypothetical protein
MKICWTLTPFAVLVSCLGSLQAAVLPYGAQLEVRLLHQVGSRASHLGDSVEASVITPFYDRDKLLVDAGATVTGSVEHIDRLGLGLRHTAARVDLHFTRLQFADGTGVPIDARVAAVETARETVRTDGAVIGINPTVNFSTGVSAVFTLASMGEPAIRLSVLGFKFLAARSPDAEISFPAGTEMLLRLTGNVELNSPPTRRPGVPLLSAAQIAMVQNALAGLPAQQTDRGRNRPSDLVNVLMIGSRDEIDRSFRAAGWSVPESHGVMAVYHMFHCAVERRSNNMLAMSTLKLNGNLPDASFEKGLDTFAKRHHIRLWHDEKAGLWLGAATEDVGYRMARMHMTHATDRRIDNERAKVVNDLAYTGCVDKGALIPRASLKPAQEDGSSIVTDGDIAVLQLNSCRQTRDMPFDPQKPVPVRAIRAAIALGLDIARSNPISVAFAATKSLLDSGRVRQNQLVQAARTYTRPSAVANASANSADGALAVR